MLESLTIFSKGGLILYQHVADPSLLAPESKDTAAIRAFTEQQINHVLSTKFLSGSATSTFHIKERVTFCWLDDNEDTICMALYPDIMFEGPREYLKEWAHRLIKKTLRAYKGFAENQENFSIRPDPSLFDETFHNLLKASKEQKASSKAEPAANAKKEVSKKAQASQGRTWHDGKNKVTEANMNALDQSDKKDTGSSNTDQALQEARKAFMPSDSDLELEDVEDNIVTFGNSVTAMFKSWTGNHALTGQDLNKPLDQLQRLMVQKNVAEPVAQELCMGIRQSLKGKKLNSMARVQTAVQQALTSTLTKLLKTSAHDQLLRSVWRRRDAILTRGRPYVICVVGINGVGKTTSLAKLAYHFQQNDCRPLLVAGDTFRSGAVEQLKVHADCLGVDFFAQGYSKDPSSVASAAVQQASSNGNNVVLIDTAGRMQNNAPLMKALQKLCTENKPDFTILVTEALVGHDGLNQFELFSKHVPAIDGILLTKFDTVSSKVGAALTMTVQTNVPIVFTGVGQKYHHLQPLKVPQVISKLLE